MEYTKEEIDKCLDLINNMKEDLTVISEMIDNTLSTFKKCYAGWRENDKALDLIRMTIQELKNKGVGRYDRPEDFITLDFCYNCIINSLGVPRDLEHASSIADDAVAAATALSESDLYSMITKLSETYEV